MASSHPLRDEAEEFIRIEIARVGPDSIDKTAIVKRYVQRGVARSRVFFWIAEQIAAAKNPSSHKPKPPPLDPILADIQTAEAAFVAEVYDTLPEAVAELERVEKAVKAEVLTHKSTPSPATATPPPVSSTSDPNSSTAAREVISSPSVVPDSARGILTHLQTVIETTGRVISYSQGADGKIKNPRVALASVDTMRRALETALKLYEAINNVQLVERFMAEMLEEVGQLQPELAKAVVARMRAVQGRWAA